VILRFFIFVQTIFLMACAGGPEAPDWRLNAAQAMQAFQQRYLVGDTAAAERDFLEVENNLRRTGRADLLARAHIVRCATHAAALEFDDCPGFEKLRGGAAAEEIAYAGYLSGKGAHKGTEDPLSRLVAAAIQLKSGTISPAAISQAVDIASAQGWRRPLLAWLGVQAKRAEDAGDGEAAAAIRRRIMLIAG
jgi:hypothetical protein